MIISLTERQKEIATGLVIVALFVLGLGGGEAALRLIEIVRFGAAGDIETAQTFYEDAETGMRLPVPGSIHGGVPINSLGFRSPEIAVPKPEGTIRLAFLGNSVTYDAYVGGDDTWPLKTTRRLRALFPGCTIDHVNAGVPGFATNLMRTYYEARVAATDPDLVIILPGDLNHDADNVLVKHGLHDGVHYEPSWLARHSLLWAKVEKNIRVIQLQRAAFHPGGKVPIVVQDVVPRFERRLVALFDTIRDESAQPVLVLPRGRLRAGQSQDEMIEAAGTALFYMPYMSIPQMIELGTAYGQATVAVAHEHGVPLIDTTKFPLPATAEYYVDSAHFTPLGSRTMGETLAATLAQVPEVRAVFADCAGAGAGATGGGS